MFSTVPFRISKCVRATANNVRSGNVNWTVLLWAIGVPLPLVLIVGLMRGCA